MFLLNIKIMTIHAMHNPGSVFQAYALQQYLKEKCNVKIIDYRPDYLYTENNQWKLFAKKLLYWKSYKSRSNKFDKFISENMKLTETYKSLDDLKNAKLKADIFMTGSDQLWNADFPCGNDPAFYLDFVDCGTKVAYSTSVGKKEIDSRNLQILKEKLADYNAIAVREKSTVDVLEQTLKRNVEWVCDPVFLLSKEKYEKFICDIRVFEEPYIMVYMSGACTQLSEIVKYYREKGYKILLAGGFTKRCYCDKHIKDVGPEDFLSLISNAEVIVSSSFHATAFCHLFHKDFITILPERNGERISNLLNVSGLQNRGVGNTFKCEELQKPINWLEVDIKLDEYISHSKGYLNSIIEK